MNKICDTFHRHIINITQGTLILESIPLNHNHLRGWWDGENSLIYCRKRHTLIVVDSATVHVLLGQPTKNTVLLDNFERLTNYHADLPQRNAPAGFAPELKPSKISLFKSQTNQKQFLTPFLTINLTVDYDLELLYSLSTLLNDLPITTEPVNLFLNINLRFTANGWEIIIDDTNCVINGLTIEQTAPYFLDIVMTMFYRQSNFKYAFHGAAFQYNNYNVYLPALSGRGKSTLFAFFNQLGAIPLSDEVIVLDGLLQPIPIPFPMTLKKGSWPLFSTLENNQKVWQRTDGRTLKYYPLKWQITKKELPCVIFFPHYSVEGNESIIKIGACKAIQNMGMSGYEFFEEENENLIASLLEWLNTIPIFELTYRSSKSAQHMIMSKLV